MWSIPACTGEPAAFDGALAAVKVYPRVYGGTTIGHKELCTVGGLSPRVRGNPALPLSRPAGSGSIPACTGEPQTPHVCWTGQKVYPRVYGGTSATPRCLGCP